MTTIYCTVNNNEFCTFHENMCHEETKTVVFLIINILLPVMTVHSKFDISIIINVLYVDTGSGIGKY